MEFENAWCIWFDIILSNSLRMKLLLDKAQKKKKKKDSRFDKVLK